MNGPADGCDNCLTSDSTRSVRPYLTEPEGAGAVRSYYRCGGCGLRWTTSRLLSDEEMAEYMDGAA